MLAFYELEFERALAEAGEAIQLADQVGNRRAFILAMIGRVLILFELGRLTEASDAISVVSEAANTLGARRLMADYLIHRALVEYAEGKTQAVETLREGVAMARESPAFMLPWGLGILAMVTPSKDEFLSALTEGEQVIGQGAIRHNVLFFNRYAIEACLARKNWAAGEHCADALERDMAEEPTPLSDFLIARARALAAVGRGRGEPATLRRLAERARTIRWQTMLPALDAALAMA